MHRRVRTPPSLVIRARSVVVMMSVAGLVVMLSPGITATASPRALHWTQMSPANSPRARYGAVTAYDAARHVVVLFGGIDANGVLLHDTWAWNGTNWKRLHPATSPPGRIYHFMAYDSTHHNVVLYGGVTTTWVGDTWTWDGTTWTEQHPAASPGNRSSYGGMSDDPAIGGVVLYGGYDQTSIFYDTWRWSGTNWTQISTTSHPVGYLPPLAYSTGLGKVIAFGGGTSDTQVFDGSDWTQLFPVHTPPPRYENGLSRVGQGAVTFGGGSGSTFFDDTWFFNGSDWVELPGPGPAARGYISLALDMAHGKVVLFGGLDANFAPLGDTWTLG